MAKLFDSISLFLIKRRLTLYHPIWGEDKTTRAETSQRWSIIKSKINDLNVNNLLDLGCAEGYFLKKSSDIDVFALGIDGDERRIRIANYLMMKEKTQKFGLSYSQINNELLDKLPGFDIILFLSVYHHVLRYNDEDYANNMLKSIYNIAKVGVFFETGMPNEISADWSDRLKSLNTNNFNAYLENIFREIGCERFENLGNTSSFYDGKLRPLYFLYK